MEICKLAVLSVNTESEIDLQLFEDIWNMESQATHWARRPFQGLAAAATQL